MPSVIWSFVKYCASFHLMYYLCACHLCLPNSGSNCFALHSETSILLLHLNVWRFLLLLSCVCVCFPLIEGELITLIVLRCCRQTPTLLRLIKQFCDLCIKFTYTAGVCFFSSFSVRRSKAVMNRRGSWCCAGFAQLCCGSCLLRHELALNSFSVCQSLFFLCFHVAFLDIKLPVANFWY